MNFCPVLIVQPTLNEISETFLRAHAERLPNVAGVVHLKEGLPAINNIPVISEKIVSRMLLKASRILFQRSWKWEQTRGFIMAIRRSNVKVVLAEYGTTGVGVLDACRETQVPLVVHFHGFDASRLDILESFRSGYSRLFREAAAIVVVSLAMKRQLIELSCPEEKIILNPCGVDCVRFKSGTLPPTSLNFLSVGRMIQKKAPHLTIAAFARVVKNIPEAKLIMIGDGPLEGVCRDLVQAFRINDAVRFMGAQPHEVVKREMQNSRAFVQHSVTAFDGDSEGTPVAVLEAGASGIPVVATRHAGIQDVILEGKTGLLSDERDIDTMSRYLLQLADEPEYAAKLGRNAAQHIRTNYSLDVTISRLAHVLQAAATHQSPMTISNKI